MQDLCKTEQGSSLGDDELGLVFSVSPRSNLSEAQSRINVATYYILYGDGEGAGGGRVCARARAAAGVGGSAVLLAREAVLQALHRPLRRGLLLPHRTMRGGAGRAAAPPAAVVSPGHAPAPGRLPHRPCLVLPPLPGPHSGAMQFTT